MFGTPYPWIQRYIDNVQHLGQYGWNWKIFTPNKLESKGNVEIVPMTAEEFAVLVEQKLGVKTNMYTTPRGVPSVHVTDFYVFSGLIFEDYMQDVDFWGITNLDVVYGRLDRFMPDSMLKDCDVFTDDINTINGVFCLFRNNDAINNLCKLIPDWQEKLAQPPCDRCVAGSAGKHTLVGTDEYDMTDVMKKANVRYVYPRYYPLHSHDRIEQHVPVVKLRLLMDGSLYELSRDTASPNWIHARPFMGREIAYFHFIITKEWPKCLL